jgi:hypothetical protein
MTEASEIIAALETNAAPMTSGRLAVVLGVDEAQLAPGLAELIERDQVSEWRCHTERQGASRRGEPTLVAYSLRRDS